MSESSDRALPLHRTRRTRGARTLLTLFLLTGLGLPAQALDRDAEAWFQVTASGPITERVRLFLEVQPRIGETAPHGYVDWRMMVLRGAVGWRLNPAWSFWLGYAYVPTLNPGRDEQRAFQQVLHESEIGPFRVSNRMRLEQREFEESGGLSWRIRHQVRVAWPLPRIPRVSLALADEVFVNLNSPANTPAEGFEQNRLFPGVSWQLQPWLRFDVNYLLQFLNGRRGRDDLLRQGAFLQWAFHW